MMHCVFFIDWFPHPLSELSQLTVFGSLPEAFAVCCNLSAFRGKNLFVLFDTCLLSDADQSRDEFSINLTFQCSFGGWVGVVLVL